jgi:hypothetical protein
MKLKGLGYYRYYYLESDLQELKKTAKTLRVAG